MDLDPTALLRLRVWEEIQRRCPLPGEAVDGFDVLAEAERVVRYVLDGPAQSGEPQVPSLKA